MSLEVKQMIVKTSIVQRAGDDETPERRDSPAAAADMREILEACRRMVVEVLRERRER